MKKIDYFCIRCKTGKNKQLDAHPNSLLEEYSAKFADISPHNIHKPGIMPLKRKFVYSVDDPQLWVPNSKK